MKYYLNNYFLFAFAMMSQCAFGQLFGAKNVIIENAGFLYDIKIVDFDNNLSNDLMVVGNNRVSMYKNLNGNGDFSQEIEIDPNMNQSFSLGLGDLNGDSFYDLVVSFFDEGALKIYLNDGNGNIIYVNTILNLPEALGIELTDLDNDNDIDIIINQANSSGIYWMENVSGDGINWDQHLIGNQLSVTRIQIAADLDGDDDIDVLTTASGSSSLLWYENLDGNGNFGAPFPIVSANYFSTLQFGDLDGDNKKDVVVENLNNIVWLKNLGGPGEFGVMQELTGDIGVRFILLADVDNDSDNDILATTNTNQIIWLENLDGQGQFSDINLIDDTLPNPARLAVGDLDGDKDLDLVSSAGIASDRRLVWYENLTILNVDSNLANKVSIVPNPVEDSFRVQSDYPVSNVKVMNASGMLLMEIEENFEQISIKNLQSGLYLIEVEIEHHKVVKKLVKK